MTKIIFAINITIDGFADHTEVFADDELLDFYTNLLNNVDCILFGRTTYQLMESYWPNVREDPQFTNSETEFADIINSIHKIVFSRTLDKVNWNNTRLVKDDVVEEVIKLKNQLSASKDLNDKIISVGSLSIASTLMNERMIDECWFLVSPIALGKGKHLFENMENKTKMQFVGSKTFKSGVIMLHYLVNNKKEE